jgi:hypothetical protein
MATIKFTLSTGSAVYKNNVDEGEVQHFIKGDRVTWYQGDWVQLEEGTWVKADNIVRVDLADEGPPVAAI